MVLFSTKRKSDYTSNRNISIMKPNTGRANLPYKSELNYIVLQIKTFCGK